MNERDMRMMYDGRNPYGSRGGYVTSERGGGRARGRGRRGRRGDRGMDYGMYPDMRGDMNYGGRADYGRYDMPRGEDMRGGDYRSGDYRGGQMSDRGDMRMGDGHYMHGRQSGYEPVEFMGYCQGYYGSPQDYGRGRDYGDMRAYNMSGMRSYPDYGYGSYGDFGEVLSEKELDEWCHKLKSKLDEREKQMFSKEAIVQKAKQIGREMRGFGEKEVEVVTLMLLDDYKRTLGTNLDTMVKIAFDWLIDEDADVKGAEKLAIYHDCIVEGED